MVKTSQQVFMAHQSFLDRQFEGIATLYKLLKANSQFKERLRPKHTLKSAGRLLSKLPDPAILEGAPARQAKASGQPSHPIPQVTIQGACCS